MVALRGTSFRPLGGMHDGGADGVDVEGLFKTGDSATTFVQASTQSTPSDKIVETVKRIREVGRDIRLLTYVTNQTVARLDLLEQELGSRCGLAVRIYDAKSIQVQIPGDNRLIQAYYDLLHHHTQYLEGIGRSSLLVPSNHIAEPHVYAFLAANLTDGSADATFVDSVVDALIIYALEGTDPDQGILRSEAEIRQRIVDVLPSAEALVADRLRIRLEAISQKEGRRIRWHKQDQRWALPYEERRRLQQAMAEDEALWIDARVELIDRFTNSSAGTDLAPTSLADMTLSTIRKAFERDGLKFSQFLDDSQEHNSDPYISDSLREVLDEEGLSGDARISASQRIISELRRMFYDSTKVQRTLLQRISRAYVVAFALKAEPRVLSYFDDVMDNTWLYVGTDILVVALSERYLSESDQHTRNLLRAAAVAGARLILAEPVLDEVLAHLRNSDRDYAEDRGYHDSLDSYEIVRHEPKILIRAYLYSQIFEMQNRPSDWGQFVGQFCDQRILHTDAAADQLRRYLMTEFSLRFENWKRVREICDPQQHEALTNSLLPIKSAEIQASIDAYIFELVIQARTTREEEQHSVEFGYQTGNVPVSGGVWGS